MIKEFSEVQTPLGVGHFIFYNDDDEVVCTVDIEGVWHTFNSNEITLISQINEC